MSIQFGSIEPTDDNFDHIEDIIPAPDVDPNAEPTLMRNKIFINHVDMFNAKHITEYLTDQTMGALNRDVEMGGEDPEESVNIVSPRAQNDTYECIGTLKFHFSLPTEDISYIVYESDEKLFEKEILSAGCVIYDISQDVTEIPKAMAALNIIIQDIEAVKSIGPKTYKRFDRIYIFILISNILTWGKTKPINRNDPEVPFTEADYKKRKAASNYADMIACEREVIAIGRKYKEVLKTYVLCCGIQYGFEEDTLMLFFKMAWQYQDLPIFLPGNNYLPLIHIQDVAKVIQAVIEKLPKKQYILVVEQIPSRPSKIMRALAYYMGRDVKEVPKEEAFLHNNISQRVYDIMTVNLKMEPAYIIDELELEFRSDLNLVQNMSNIIMEFRVARNLVPMKVLIHGPLGSGKTSLADHFVKHYGVHYVNVRTMIDETRETLKVRIDAEIEARKMKKTSADDEDEEEVADEGAENEYEPIVNLEGLQEQLKTLEVALENNNGVLPDAYVIKLMRLFLARNICQNQGYVLDGYPKTMEQCVELFGSELDRDADDGEGADEDENENDVQRIPGRTITPQFVISLEADDSFLIDVMMDFPETRSEIYDEEHIMKKLRDFRENNTEENTMLNFFDEHEIHPINIFVQKWMKNYEGLYEMIKNVLGPPIGFELSTDERNELLQCQQEAERLKAEQADIEKEIMEREALKEYEEKMEERIRILDELQREEEKILMVQCEPLRQYLMMHVFPTLTQGLLEIARIKPADPVDYLAEYLFKFNPEGKMFEPTFTERGQSFENNAKSVKSMQKAVKKMEEIC